ncbi:hypothetical protein IV203_008767 [Nitzschia inconspicua]|uniref:DUF6824 domain-containing protein n=1 Tax=Nitzschia inconspicua TaxID=303405 RepID=A0A9K3L050_9STRA|nr:hypothetical protein IV203_008767 [Nitzschia inconspicua]
MCSSMQDTNPTIITSINDADVLSGRGGKTNMHKGNRIYRAIVKENRPKYQELKKISHKQLMAESIIATVHKRGGKFLKRAGKDQDSWTELSKDEAMIKTTQALREIPSGTSSRALNVERMLEQKRKQNAVASSNNSNNIPDKEDHTVVIPSTIAPASKAAVPTIRHGSVVVSNDYAQGPNFADNDDGNNSILSDEEVESIINDSDAFETIVSLLDK